MTFEGSYTETQAFLERGATEPKDCKHCKTQAWRDTTAYYQILIFSRVCPLALLMLGLVVIHHDGLRASMASTVLDLSQNRRFAMGVVILCNFGMMVMVARLI